MRHRLEPTELAASEGGVAAGGPFTRSGGLVPLSLVVVALLASVIIPARQTWVITKLLRETTEMLAPARVTAEQLQSGLADEMGALQRYALSSDESSLRQYAATAAKDDQRLASLEALGEDIGGAFVSHVTSVRTLVADWRRSVLVVHDRGALARTLQTAQLELDRSRAAVAGLSSDLLTEVLA